MRAIDADALIAYLTDNWIPANIDAIDAQPTIEPERKTGKWVIRETAFGDIEATCSCCGFETLVNEPGNGLHMVDDLNDCPNCGAYTDGEPKEE